jgi:hypothetical protein
MGVTTSRFVYVLGLVFIAGRTDDPILMLAYLVVGIAAAWDHVDHRRREAANDPGPAVVERSVDDELARIDRDLGADPERERHRDA